MPGKKTSPLPPARYTVEDLASARGIRPASVVSALYRTRVARREGREPVNPVPEPEPGRILSWRADRLDVQDWMESGVRERASV